MVYVSRKALERTSRIGGGNRPSPYQNCVTLHLMDNCPWRGGQELVAVGDGEVKNHKKCGYCFEGWTVSK
jgi:hypothetical protein